MSKKPTLQELLGKLDTSLTSDEYHSLAGSYSSSQLKKIIEDPEIFKKLYITKEMEREESDNFTVGSYFHTAILEPEKLDDECCVFTGKIRSGKSWEEFKEANKGKYIITSSEKEKVDGMVAAVKKSTVANNCLKGSSAEVSAFLELFIMGDEVFCFPKWKEKDESKCLCLTASGWVPSSMDFEEEDIKDYAVRLVMKVRADAIQLEGDSISDLKSTTGNAKDTIEMQKKVDYYEYDLSAALYLDIFSAVTGRSYENFYWIFASKDFHNSRTYRASDRNIMVGRAKWKFAVCEIAKYQSNKWNIVETMGVIEPTYFSLNWLK